MKSYVHLNSLYPDNSNYIVTLIEVNLKILHLSSLCEKFFFIPSISLENQVQAQCTVLKLALYSKGLWVLKFK